MSAPVDMDSCGFLEPCWNGGTCENTGLDAYLCTCPQGFSGKNCEVSDNGCVSGLCHNGGTCTETDVGGYNCSCSSGWVGPTCQISKSTCYFSFRLFVRMKAAINKINSILRFFFQLMVSFTGLIG